MSNKIPRDKLAEHLESLVDQHGVSYVLGELSGICYAKGEHLATNWQDAEVAAAWHKLSAILSSATHTAQLG